MRRISASTLLVVGLLLAATGAGAAMDSDKLLAVGQKVQVEVVRIDAAKEGEKGERIALSMKALQQDPWQAAMAQLQEGQSTQGGESIAGLARAVALGVVEARPVHADAHAARQMFAFCPPLL